MIVLEAQGIWKYLGGHLVLRDAGLLVSRGDRVFVLGDNGSGKSTLLQILTGVLPPDGGNSVIHGGAGYAPEKPDLPNHLLVGEWLDLLASLKRLRTADPLEFGVAELRRRKIGALSLGQRQRVSLASAWMGTPAVLVLDEPTNGLDTETRAAVIQQLGQRTAIVATHDRELAEAVSTRTVTLKDGTLGSGQRLGPMPAAPR